MQPTNHHRHGSNPTLQLGTCVFKRARDWKKVGRERQTCLTYRAPKFTDLFSGRRRVRYMLKRSIPREIHFFFNAIFLAFVHADSNTSNDLLQLATQHCSVASSKALLHVLPPTSNIITQLNFVVVSWTSVYFFNNLQQQNFFAWQCLRCVVIRATRFWTCNATMLRWKLKKNVSRITRPLRGQQHGRAQICKCHSCFVKLYLDCKCCSWTKSVSSWLPLLASASLVGPFRTDGVDPSFNQHHRFTSCHTVCLINQASGTLLRLKENCFFF